MTAQAEFQSVCTEARRFVPKPCMPVQPVGELGDGEQLSKPISQSLIAKQLKGSTFTSSEQVTTTNLPASKS